MATSKKYRPDLECDLDWEIFAKNLKSCMDTVGFTNADLSRATNISTASISRYFHGRTIDLTTAVVFADYFNVSLDWLIGRSEAKYITADNEAAKMWRKYQLSSPEDKRIIDILLSKTDA